MNYSEIELEKKVKSEIDKYEALFNYDGPGKMIDWRVYLKNQESLKDTLKPNYTGITELDYLMDGFVAGELVVLTGLRANGKTLFTKSIIRGLGSNGDGTALFCLEDRVSIYLQSFLDMDINIFVPEENKHGDLKWLEDRIKEAKVKHNIKYAIVDHMHYVVNMSAAKLHQDIGSVMRRLKILAMKEDLVIFIICHQKALSDTKAEPSLDTSKDSSAIAQECDTGLVVHRIRDYDNDTTLDSYDMGYAFVKVDKARRTGTYKKKMTFVKKGDFLEPI